MFISGTLGTVIGDFCSHNMGLDDAGASILLSPIVAVLFLAGRGGRLLLLPFYWLTVVLIRAAGTAVEGFHLRTQHAWPAREHCRHGGSLHCPPGHLEGAVEIGERAPSLPDEVRLAP
jgi:hypothetical protein